MSHLSKIFEEAPIKVQNRNGFDLSHLHSGTSMCGQLVPVLTKLLAPNTTFTLGVNAEVSLPPMVAPFYGKIDFAIEGFIVPCSIIYGGFKQWISNNEVAQFPLSQSSLQTNYDGLGRTTISNTSTIGYRRGGEKPGYALPYFDFYHIGNNAYFNTLASSNSNIYDYMGLNCASTVTASVTDKFPISLLPAICYHRICDVFYRNTKLTRTWFAVNPNAGYDSSGSLTPSDTAQGIAFNKKNVSLIWHSFYSNQFAAGALNSDFWGSPEFYSTAHLTFPDGVSVFSTRQRQYSRDYFTSAVYSPQQGGVSRLEFPIDTSDQSGFFTIPSLKMAASLDKFLSTNNLSGDYADINRNRWGVRPIDADFEEPHYLGRVVIPVYQHTIYKQDATADLSSNSNPFVNDGLLGSSASVARANGEGSICDNFTCTCWSYLMCLASLYPHANYNYGINRELTMTSLGDWPAPELQGVGMEEIKGYELSAAVSDSTVSSFTSSWGYIPRYSRFKYIDDHSSGNLRPGKSMEQYQLQRAFATTPSLGTSFVEIATTDLDGVLAVSTSNMSMTCWWEIFFNFKVVMPLSDFIIPTLGEMPDTHTIKTSVGGSRL